MLQNINWTQKVGIESHQHKILATSILAQVETRASINTIE